MKTRRLTPAAGLLAVFSLAGANAAHACKYCWSGENVEAADYARQAMQPPTAPGQANGAFPLDATISQFQPAAPTAATASVYDLKYRCASSCVRAASPSMSKLAVKPL